MMRTLTALTLLLASTAVWAGDDTKTEASKSEAPKAAATAPAEVKASEAKTGEAKSTGVSAAGVEKLMEGYSYEPKDIDIVYGDDKATITVVEYASLSCPHCQAFYKDVFPLLQKNYIDTGKIKLVFRNFPLNQPAMDAGQMVLCADKESRATFMKVLFSTQEKWAYDVNYREAIAGIAALGGMERKKFDACMANKELQDKILLGYQEARTNFKVVSTPTIFIANDMLKGSHSYEMVSKAIDEALSAHVKK